MITRRKKTMLKLANKVERDNNFPYEKVLAVSTDLIPY